MAYLARVVLQLTLIMSLLAIPPAAPAAAAGPGGPRAFAVLRGQAAKLSYGGATLDIGADALAAPTTITIAPLSDTDLAAGDQGMTNATLGPQRGYRFLPHMQFRSKIRVTLPYDKALIPAGLAQQDLKTYFFNESTGGWEALERVAVDPVAGTVTSLTDHFTDMINATVAVPDHPETLSYNPTSIKDIKAADPGAGINLIAPPQANSTGDARLSYELAVPPGRQGVQPHLALAYSSSGGNGWVGLGWDLSVPSITVDTRWGVPRYLADKETESYLLAGEQLTPLAHRGDWQPREPDKDRDKGKQFHTRVEGGFQKIVRYGTSPKDYWWEVTDKAGTRYVYGADARGGAPRADATLVDGQENIFRWALREVRDLNGNGVRYSYTRVYDVGVPGGTVPGVQLYLQSANYTQSGGAEGPYTVTFIRDSQADELRKVPQYKDYVYERRPDVVIDARGGFKMVTAELLKRIDVTFKGDRVRSYDLEYQRGAFEKTLLKSITQRGADGAVFNTHGFAYHDDLSSGQGFGAPADWYTGERQGERAQDDGVTWLTGSPVEQLLSPLQSRVDFGKASALSGSVTDSLGGHLYVGFNPTTPLKSTSVGGKVGFNGSGNEAVLALLDLDGDGLPDKVFKKDGGIFFRRNQSGPQGTTDFGPARPVTTLPALARESSQTFSAGLEGYLGIGVVGLNALGNYADTFTTGSAYFSDVNGDGLPDLVKDGQVWFNHLDQDRTPVFTPHSGDTPVTVVSRAGADQAVVQDFVDSYKVAVDKAIETNPLHDTLRRWTAPFDGRIRITGDVQLIESKGKDPSTGKDRSEYTTADGVRVAIQHNGGAFPSSSGVELWSTSIAANDYAPKTPTRVETIAVRKGDRIYFRVQSVFDGRYDQVNWDPEIAYLDVPTVTDVNGLNPYRYKASEDFVPAGRRDLFVQMPLTGTLRLTGLLRKLGTTTDGVSLLVLKNGTPAIDPASLTLAPDQTGDLAVAADIEVAKDDRVQLRVRVDSPIDLRQLRWEQSSLVYVAAADPNQRITDDAGKFLLQLTPPYDADFYPANGLTAPQPAWRVARTGKLTVTPRLATGLLDSSTKGRIVFTVKRRGELLAKRVIHVVNGQVQDGQDVAFDLDVTAGTELYFDFSTDDPELRSLIGARVKVSYEEPDPDDPEGVRVVAVDAPSAFHSTEPPGLFAQPYRGWAYAGYNGNGARGNQPVDEALLVFNKDDYAVEDPDTKALKLKPECENRDPQGDFAAAPCNGATAKGYPFYPVPDKGYWRGPDELAWVSAAAISSSRLGGDYFAAPQASDLVPSPQDRVQDDTVRTVSRLSHTTQWALGLGADVAVVDGIKLGASGSGSGVPLPGSSKAEVDYLDLNGDGFPDIVSKGRVQFTTPLGGFAAGSTPIRDIEQIRESSQPSWNIGVSGNPAFAVGTSRAHVNTPGGESQKGNKASSQMVRLGFGGSLGFGASSVLYDLVDVNGDGLPDRVTREGNQLKAALNLGYDFARVSGTDPNRPLAYEPWGDAAIADGASREYTLSGSGGVSAPLGYTDGIYGFGGGLSLSKNDSQAACKSTFPALDGSCRETGTTLLDVNGDGLLDRVSADGAGLRVSFNTGNGFGPPTAWTGTLAPTVARSGNTGLGGGLYFTIGVPLCGVACYLIINPGVDYTRSIGRDEMALRDVDGDGLPDHVSSARDGLMTVALNRMGRANLLKSVRRPLGATVDLDYARSGNTHEQPQSRWVLSQVRVFDGHPGDGDTDLRPAAPPDARGPDPSRYITHLATYRYAGGFYDRAEREFYGYASVTEEHRDPAKRPEDPPYRSIVREFRNDSFYTKGLLTRELAQGTGGQPFTETTHEYAFRDVASAAEPSAPPARRALLGSPTATVFPRLRQTDRRFFERGSNLSKSTYTTQKHDLLGNVVGVFDAGDLDAADDVSATVEYSDCGGTYVVGVPTKILVSTQGAVKRHREAGVDCATGQVRQVRQFLEDGTAAVASLDYCEHRPLDAVPTPDQCPKGNLWRVTGPPNKKKDQYQLTYTYDPHVLTYVASVTDNFSQIASLGYPAGYSSSATYDPRFGEPLSTTDTNNNQTRYTYDAFGRLTTVTGPYELGGATPTISFQYHHAVDVPWALTQHLDAGRGAGATIDTVLFTDGLKRVLQTKKSGTVHTGPDGAAQDVMLVSGRVTFDFLGRTIEQRYPVTEPLPRPTGSPGVFNPTVDATPCAPARSTPCDPTRMEYDVLDRNTTTTLPDGTSTSIIYDFGPDRSGATQFETTVTDANGVQKKTYRDVRELITSVKEFHTPPGGAQQVIWTSYAHDPLRQLVEVRDDKNNLTKVDYDNLGRRTVVDNPDTGKTETTYDLASNVVARVTANLRARGQRIVYDYDFNRLTAITYPNFPGNNVTYTYGGPGAPWNRAGRIVMVKDQSGGEERSYGKLGEVTTEVKTVVGFTGAGPDAYRTEYAYDTFGRLRTLTYPDGEVLTYQYDAGGLLRGAVGQKGGVTYPYIKRLEYDKFEQRAFLEAGNGVRTQYSYRPDNRRLANLKAAPAGGIPFQNLAYDYDKVGNVLSLTNKVDLPPPSQFGGPSKQTFAYDDLYRLTSASGSYQFGPGKTQRYSLSLAYDSVHNILAKQQADEVVQPSGVPIPQQKTSYAWTYAYGGAHPHAPMHLGDRTFGYDANGNQTGWTNDLNGTRRTVVWDDENRVQSVFDNGHEKAYKYDAAGERVVKRGPQGETAYVNQFFTVRSRTNGTKHVYAGSTRLVSKLMKTGAVEKDQYFYHPDHLGSSSYVTDAGGALYQHLEYFPFGETWIQEATNTQRTPYLFTAKELDEETGLYYFGARYYDPRAQVWQSPDPILGSYLDGVPNGGVHKAGNLAFYTYAYNNPVVLTDPDGRAPSLSGLTETIAEAGGGVTYGTVQSLAPGGFLMPSPAPQSRTFEFFRAAGQIATGIAQMVGGGAGEIGGFALDATGVGAVVGVPLNVAAAVVIVQGAANVTAGVDTLINAMAMSSTPHGAGGVGGGSGSSGETPIPTRSYEDARNRALGDIGKIDPTTRADQIGRLGEAKGKITGFSTRVDGVWKRYRVDWDPNKGTHINVEISAPGKETVKNAYTWPGTKEEYLKVIETLNR
jgi:RHS repeat-associated protein